MCACRNVYTAVIGNLRLSHQHSKIQEDHHAEVQEIDGDEEDLLDVYAVEVHHASRRLQAGGDPLLVLAQCNLIADKRGLGGGMRMRAETGNTCL